MRNKLKLVLAAGLAGAGFSGYLLWRELFVVHGTALGSVGGLYAAFVVLVIGSGYALRRTQPIL